MSKFGVSIGREKSLKKNMRLARVYEKDIDESFVLSSGPGGQNVNKVATCVVLVHRPSHISIKYQKSRSQAINRYWARRILLDEITKRAKQKKQRILQQKQKERARNRKRSRQLKEEILAGKAHRSELKRNRKKVDVRSVEY